MPVMSVELNVRGSAHDVGSALVNQVCVPVISQITDRIPAEDLPAFYTGFLASTSGCMSLDMGFKAAAQLLREAAALCEQAADMTNPGQTH